jgi:hypothetical protein
VASTICRQSARQSLAALLFCLVATAAPLSAALAEGPLGIAFVEAPERSFGHCTSSSLDQAFTCARARCAVDGVKASDCMRRAWCYPAGWTADVFLQHREGPHWHEYSCGWDSRESAVKAVAIRCDKAARPYLIECAVVRFFDPQGKEYAPD